MMTPSGEARSGRGLLWHDKAEHGNPAAGHDVVRVRWLEVGATRDADWPRLEAMLDEAERARAQRFHFARDRHVFTLAHALARALLTVAAGGALAPSGWRFTEGPVGKPEAVCPPGCPRLRVNLSHTRGLAAVALAVDHDVGVDVEWTGRPADNLDFMASVFEPPEVTAVRAAPQAERMETFLAFWTVKEAVVKAAGTGFSQGLNAFSVTLEPLSLCFLDNRDVADRWMLRRLTPGPDHRMALAVRCDQPARLRVDAAPANIADLLALAP